MTPFTDENLTRLKEFKDKYQYFNFPTAWEANQQYDLINSLLLRLEAAEELAHALAFVPTEGWDQLYVKSAKWRKAAGKERVGG